MAVLEKSGTGTYEIPELKNGIYTARHTGEIEQFTSPFANDDGEFPEKLRHVWEVDGPDGAVQLSSFTSLKVGHERATMTGYFAAACGDDYVAERTAPGSDLEFDTDDLIGKTVSVTVKNKQNKDGQKVPRVVEVDAAE